MAEADWKLKNVDCFSYSYQEIRFWGVLGGVGDPFLPLKQNRNCDIIPNMMILFCIE